MAIKGAEDVLRRPDTLQRAQVRQGPGKRFLIGYLEGIDSQRGIAWCWADSPVLRIFLGIVNADSKTG